MKKPNVIELIDLIEGFDSNQIFELNNLFCEHAHYYDNFIYCNDDEFLETFFASKTDVARAVQFGDYNIYHDYVRFNGYGNLESMDFLNVDDLPDLTMTIADYILENYEDFEQFFNN